MTDFNIVQAGPLPFLQSIKPYQRGIIDPVWPEEPRPDEDVSIDEERYPRLRGKMDPQEFLTIARVDVSTRTSAELASVLKKITSFCQEQMNRTPDQTLLNPSQYVPHSYRVTITVGLGASLFMDSSGRDRFGFLDKKPRSLRTPPEIFGDNFDCEDDQTDLVFLIASDHKYVNAWIARKLERISSSLRIAAIDEGFARPDKRSFGGFEDGISNIGRMPLSQREKFVFVGRDSDEPNWCQQGSYLVFRKIEQNLKDWDRLKEKMQSKMIGRNKPDGKPLSRRVEDASREPIFPDPASKKDGPLKSHSRAVNPRRISEYTIGFPDESRRFLRRGYPFVDNVPLRGQEDKELASFGLHFIAFMNDISAQFEYISQVWQMNPDFPVPGAGRDTMFEREIFKTVAGGYYFCPPDAVDDRDFIGSGLFK